jgi:predicted TIM-barrel enzyme
MGFSELLKGKLLIGMSHQPPVSEGIGKWNYTAEKNIDALVSAGFKAVILENDGDKDLVANPRYTPEPERLKEVEKYMIDTGSMVRKKFPGISLGYQILWNYWGSIKVAHETGGDFIRSQLYWESRATPSGLILEQNCFSICRFKKENNCDIAVLADIDSKGTRKLGNYSRELAIASLATSNYAPQGLVFTGNGINGDAPTKSSFIAFNEEVRRHSALPVGGGRGLDFTNYHMFVESPATFWIVGSSIKQDGYISQRKAADLAILVGK